MGHLISYLVTLSIGKLVSLVVDLKVHLVYVAWNADGTIIYAGQTTLSLMERVKGHVTHLFSKKKKSRCDKQMLYYLKNGGLRFSIVASGLSKKEADRLEVIMIAISKRGRSC
jgi:hypothetical protein